MISLLKKIFLEFLKFKENNFLFYFLIKKIKFEFIKVKEKKKEKENQKIRFLSEKKR